MNRDLVKDHIDHCMELWSNSDSDGVKGRRVNRDTYEMMRSDLMVLVGICMALSAKDDAAEKPRSPF